MFKSIFEFLKGFGKSRDSIYDNYDYEYVDSDEELYADKKKNRRRQKDDDSDDTVRGTQSPKEKESSVKSSDRRLSVPIRGRFDLSDKNARLIYIRDNCEQIINAQKNIDETISEYTAVTDYIADIQKIEMLDKSKIKELQTKVDRLSYLDDEKEMIKKRRKTGISDDLYYSMAADEETIIADIKKLEEYEDHHLVIEDDMRKLEGERGTLKYEKKSAQGSQEFLKVISTALLMMVIIFVCLFICLDKLYGKDMQIPYMVMIFAAGIVCVIIVVQTNINRRTIKTNAMKMNRLIELMNKTKIKYVNSKSVIDYMYQKYDIKTSQELKYRFGEYQKRKENEKAFKENIRNRDAYGKSVTDLLAKYGVKDTEIWLRQLDALINTEQMDKLKTRLEMRRDKLKANIDYNNNLKDTGMDALREVIRKNSGYKIEVVAILKRYGIKL